MEEILFIEDFQVTFKLKDIIHSSIIEIHINNFKY